MRHGKKFNHLSRKRGHRKALLKNLSIALITHKRINTTLAKAKALRVHIEPLITKSKTNSTHSRRVVFSYLQNKYAVKELFEVIADKIGDRPGGYCRILKTGFRQGDGAEMAMIELVDFNEIFVGKSDISEETGGRKRRRSRRGSSKKATTVAAVEEAVEELEEEMEEVEEEIEEIAEEMEEATEEIVDEITEEEETDKSE